MEAPAGRDKAFSLAFYDVSAAAYEFLPRGPSAKAG
jgi:hypothetical protein